MELAETQDVTLVGLADASVETIERYRVEQDIEFPILANATAQRKQWGVRMIWGNVVRLVNPEGRIVAEGLKGVGRALAARTP